MNSANGIASLMAPIPFIASIKDLNEVMENSLWPYVKNDIVKTFNGTPIELNTLVSNAVSMENANQINLAYWEAVQCMINRTNRYAFLLTLYGHIGLRLASLEKSAVILGKIKNIFEKLKEKLIELRFDRIPSISFHIEVINQLCIIVPKNALSQMALVLNSFLQFFVQTGEINSNSISDFLNLYIREENLSIQPAVLEKLLTGFPVGGSYDFHNLPTEGDDAVDKINDIIRLINREYSQT